MRPLEPPLGASWTVEALVGQADDLRGSDSAVVAFDAPIGLPRSFLAAAGTETFMGWMEEACLDPARFSPVATAPEWTVTHPFFRVEKGTGGLGRFVRAAARAGVELRREVEQQTGAKSVFALGIPGQVGPAAQALWCEISEARRHGWAFAVWPFETSLPGAGVVVAEIYPRAAYGVALAQRLPAPPRWLAKTKPAVRVQALDELVSSDWIGSLSVRLSGLEHALGSENDFDALVTAAAVLRLVLDERPLATSERVDPVAEGGILCV